jgi:hypothetical protein
VKVTTQRRDNKGPCKDLDFIVDSKGTLINLTNFPDMYLINYCLNLYVRSRSKYCEGHDPAPSNVVRVIQRLYGIVVQIWSCCWY